MAQYIHGDRVRQDELNNKLQLSGYCGCLAVVCALGIPGLAIYVWLNDLEFTSGFWIASGVLMALSLFSRWQKRDALKDIDKYLPPSPD